MAMTSPSPTLVRADDLDALVRRVRLDGGALCVYGEPGAGKTALLAAAARAAIEDGRIVRRAAGAPMESDLPYATLHELLGPLPARLGEIPADQGRALTVALALKPGPAPDPRLVADAVTTLLSPARDELGVLIVVDDLQWVDLSSLDVLLRIAEGAARARMGVLVAARGTTPPPTIGAMPSALVSGRRVETGTDRVHRAYEAEVAALPGATRRALLLAALIGTADIDLPATTPGLALARREQVIVADPETARLRFRHPLLRSAVVRASTSLDRADAHRELARVFAGVPHRHARYLAEATLHPDEKVAALLERGARQSLHLGEVGDVVSALLRAADLSPTPAGRSRRLAQAAYVCVSVRGDLQAAPQLLDAAREAHPDGRQLALPAAVAAAQVMLNLTGDVNGAHGILSAGLDATTDFTAGNQELVDALFDLCDVCRYASRDELWERLFTAIDRLGPEAPPLLILRAHVQRGPAYVTDADLAHLAGLLSRFDTERNPAHIDRVTKTALALDLSTACHPTLRRIVADGPAGGAARTAVSGLLTLTQDELAAGRWDEAGRLADETVRRCDDSGYVFPAQIARMSRLQLAALRGDDTTVREHSSQVTAWAAPRRLLTLVSWCHAVQAAAAVGRGDFESAYHHSVAACEPGRLPTTAMFLRPTYDLVESAMRTNRPEAAAAHVRALHEAGVARISDRLALMVAGASAMTAEPHLAPALFAQALALPGVEQYPWDAARLRLMYGERLRRARAITEAREQLNAALATFRRLGAYPWIHRAIRELEATSVTRARSGGQGSATLTPQENEVAGLAAAGLTNKKIGERLFMSPRTAGTHLQRVYRKLGIGSRAALRHALREPEPD